MPESVASSEDRLVWRLIDENPANEAASEPLQNMLENRPASGTIMVPLSASGGVYTKCTRSTWSKNRLRDRNAGGYTKPFGCFHPMAATGTEHVPPRFDIPTIVSHMVPRFGQPPPTWHCGIRSECMSRYALFCWYTGPS